MRRISLYAAAAALTLAGLTWFTSPAQAQYGGGHQHFHGQLYQNQLHRYLYHDYAHQFPMTWRQHGRLHDALDHAAYHDRLAHREFHRQYYTPPHGNYHYYGGGSYYGNGYYSPSYGFGFQSPGLSIYLGR